MSLGVDTTRMLTRMLTAPSSGKPSREGRHNSGIDKASDAAPESYVPSNTVCSNSRMLPGPLKGVQGARKAKHESGR